MKFEISSVFFNHVFISQQLPLLFSESWKQYFEAFENDLLNLGSPLKIISHVYNFPIGYHLQSLLHLAYDTFGWTSTLDLFRNEESKYFVKFLTGSTSNTIDYSDLLLAKSQLHSYKTFVQHQFLQMKESNLMNTKNDSIDLLFPDYCQTPFYNHLLLHVSNFQTSYCDSRNSIYHYFKDNKPDEPFLFVPTQEMKFIDLPSSVPLDVSSYKLAFFIYTVESLLF
jgi:hypothetical protein